MKTTPPRPLTGSEQTPPTNCWSCGATLAPPASIRIEGEVRRRLDALRNPMTDIDIEALRELSAEATGAPWCVHPNGTSAWRGADWDTVNEAHGRQYRHVCNAASVDAAGIADIELIVAMRNNFSAILDELAATRAELAAVKADPMWARINELGARLLAVPEPEPAEAERETLIQDLNDLHILALDGALTDNRRKSVAVRSERLEAFIRAASKGTK